MVESVNKKKARGRGRPRGVPTQPKTLNFEVRHLQYLDALAKTASGGKPSFTSQVAEAMERFIKSELAKPGIRAEVEQYLGKQRRSVLREVKK